MVSIGEEDRRAIPKQKWWHLQRYHPQRVLVRLDEDDIRWMQRLDLYNNGGRVLTVRQFLQLRDYQKWYRQNQELAEETRQIWEQALLPLDHIELTLTMTPPPDEEIHLEDVDDIARKNRNMDF